MIPYGRQDISQEDINAVIEVLKSDFLTQGPQVPLFEKSVKEPVNAEYALVVNSATYDELKGSLAEGRKMR
jgi:dTDP-4-amino-4,6-dideoxygalactose transaminase